MLFSPSQNESYKGNIDNSLLYSLNSFEPIFESDFRDESSRDQQLFIEPEYKATFGICGFMKKMFGCIQSFKDMSNNYYSHGIQENDLNLDYQYCRNHGAIDYKEDNLNFFQEKDKPNVNAIIVDATHQKLQNIINQPNDSENNAFGHFFISRSGIVYKLADPFFYSLLKKPGDLNYKKEMYDSKEGKVISISKEKDLRDISAIILIESERDISDADILVDKVFTDLQVSSYQTLCQKLTKDMKESNNEFYGIFSKDEVALAESNIDLTNLDDKVQKLKLSKCIFPVSIIDKSTDIDGDFKNYIQQRSYIDFAKFCMDCTKCTDKLDVGNHIRDLRLKLKICGYNVSFDSSDKYNRQLDESLMYAISSFNKIAFNRAFEVEKLYLFKKGSVENRIHNLKILQEFFYSGMYWNKFSETLLQDALNAMISKNMDKSLSNCNQKLLEIISYEVKRCGYIGDCVQNVNCPNYIKNMNNLPNSFSELVDYASTAYYMENLDLKLNFSPKVQHCESGILSETSTFAKNTEDLTTEGESSKFNISKSKDFYDYNPTKTSTFAKNTEDLIIKDRPSKFNISKSKDFYDYNLDIGNKRNTKKIKK